MKFEFHREAESEFIECAAYYQAEVPGLGGLFADEVTRGIELLLDNPLSGTRIIGEIRRLVLRRFPHSIIYTVIDDLLLILAVSHGSRAPGYWMSRVSDNQN